MSMSVHRHEQTREPAVRRAEQSAVACLLFLNDAIDLVAEDLRPEHFRFEPYRVAYAAILRMRDRGSDTIDAVTLAEELQQAGELETVGGPYALAEMCEAVPHAEHARHYAKIVRNDWLRRQIDRLCFETRMQTATADPEDLLADLQRHVHVLTAENAGGEGYATAATALHEYVDSIESAAQTTIPTGFEKADYFLGGGFAVGRTYILAARTSKGKTALACNFTYHALQSGWPVYFTSVEMNRAEIAGRILKRMSGGNVRDVGVQNRFASLPLFVDSESQQLTKIVSRTRRQVHLNGPGLVIVDYLQLIEHGDRRVPRYERVGDISRALKLLAGELRVPIVALAQLNRETDRRDGEPRLSDLRDSGSIEQDADCVLFLHQPDAERPHRELTVAKNRSGRTGYTMLNWYPDTQTFTQS